MKYNDIGQFLDALHDQIVELESQPITSATDIEYMDMSKFSPEEIEKFDNIKDEATALCEVYSAIEDYIVNRLTDLGYSDDDICLILDYEGL